MGMRVSLTERVSIETGGTVVDEQRFPGRQGRLVFAYLLAEQGRPVPRGELAEALWGDAPPATWEKALSVLVSKLRSLLNDCGLDGSEALTSAFGCYQLTLPSGTWIDVVAADEAVSAAELALAAGDVERARTEASTAESLARHTFLPGEDARWVEEKRSELRETLVRALECLAVTHRLGGDTRAAVRAAEELVELEPYRERGYRLLMEAQSAAGNDAEALRTYERCRRLLADELGTYPSSETEAIYRRLLEEPLTAADTATVPALPDSRPSHEPQRKKRRSLLLIAGSLVLAAGVAIAAVQLSEGRSAEQKIDTLGSARCSALHYEGSGSPERLIAVSLPLGPGGRGTTTPIVNAITMQLERRKYTAGGHTVGLQFCEEAGPRDLIFDKRVCTANARMYVGNPSVIGVVGPLTSGCAWFSIPILNRAPGGPVPLVSPSATVVGLTQPFRSSNPDALYPSGQRNFARILPTDDVHAAASALAARRLGVRRVYALDSGNPDSAWFVDAFARAARRLGISVVGRGSWDLGGIDCRPPCTGELSTAKVAAAAAQAGADGVFLGIEDYPTTVRLLSVLRARLGPDVQLMAPESFGPATALLAGAAAEGMTLTQPGPLTADLPPSGKRLVASFTERFGAEPTRYAVSAAQAIDLLLDAIARSDGSRASVTRNLFGTRASDRIFRNFWITPTGDSTLNAVAVYRISKGKLTPFETVLVPDALVATG